MDPQFNLVLFGYEPKSVQELFAGIEQQHLQQVTALLQQLEQCHAQTERLASELAAQQANWQELVQDVGDAVQSPPFVPYGAVSELREQLRAHAVEREQLRAQLEQQRAVRARLRQLRAGLAAEIGHVCGRIEAAVGVAGGGTGAAVRASGTGTGASV